MLTIKGNEVLPKLSSLQSYNNTLCAKCQHFFVSGMRKKLKKFAKKLLTTAGPLWYNISGCPGLCAIRREKGNGSLVIAHIIKASAVLVTGGKLLCHLALAHTLAGHHLATVVAPFSTVIASDLCGLTQSRLCSQFLSHCYQFPFLISEVIITHRYPKVKYFFIKA